MVLTLNSYANEIVSDTPIGTGGRADYFVLSVDSIPRFIYRCNVQ